MDIKGTMVNSSHLMHNTAQNSPPDSPLKPSTWQLDDTVALRVIIQNHLKVWLKGSCSTTSLVGCEMFSVGDSSPSCHQHAEIPALQPAPCTFVLSVLLQPPVEG